MATLDLAYQREWCRKNPEKRRKHAETYYKRHKEELSRIGKLRKKRKQVELFLYLVSHPCVDCGEDDIEVLEFDHKEMRRRRKPCVSDLCVNSTWEKTKDHIEKFCEVRCSNCHTYRTRVQTGYPSRMDHIRIYGTEKQKTELVHRRLQATRDRGE